MSAMRNPEATPYALADEAQAAFDAAGLPHWRIVPVAGNDNDPLARLRAERNVPGSTFGVTSDNIRVLLDLARDADARLDANTAPVQVSAGTLDSRQH